MRVATVVSAENGTVPVIASTRTSASEYTSVRPSTGRPLACSGDGVARRAEHHTRGLRPRRLGDGASEPEVGDAEPAVVAEQEVRRLDVAVHEPSAVGVVETACRLETDEQRLRRREASTSFEHRPQRAVGEELEHQIRDAALLAPVVDGHDVRVVERGRRLRLGAEALDERRIVGQRRMQDLHRDRAPQGDVFGAVDGRRCARANGREQPVAPAQHPAHQLLSERGHDQTTLVRGHCGARAPAARGSHCGVRQDGEREARQLAPTGHQPAHRGRIGHLRGGLRLRRQLPPRRPSGGRSELRAGTRRPRPAPDPHPSRTGAGRGHRIPAAKLTTAAGRPWGPGVAGLRRSPPRR